MKREDLEKLRQLKQELDTLITEYVTMPHSQEVGDTYGDYRTGHKVVKVMHGVSTIRSDRLRNKIERKQRQLEAEVSAMEDFLDNIDDTRLRDILRLYYAKGLTQEEIGKKKNYSRQRIQQLLDEFWDKRKD